MTKIYDVIAQRKNSKGYILFYSDNKEEAISAIGKYDKEHGFSVDLKKGTFAITDIILRERESTGKELRVISYRELFDIYGKRRA